MKVLAIHRYYYPDNAPYGLILKSIVEKWSSDKHEIDVLTSTPSYNFNHKKKFTDKNNGVNIVRINLPNEQNNIFIKLINSLVFCFFIFKQSLIISKYDVIMVSTVPQILGGFTVALISKIKKIKFIYHCQDINPEIAKYSGLLNNIFFYKLLLLLDKWTCKKAHKIITLSKDMSNALIKRDKSIKKKILIIKNLCPHNLKTDSQNYRYLNAKNKLTILYAGNIGKFQNLDFIVDVMIKLKKYTNITLIIIGEGNLKKKIINKINIYKPNITIRKFQDFNNLKKIFERIDLCITGLIPGIYKYCYPSKIGCYLSMNKPILVSVERSSNISKEIINNKLGFVVSNKDNNFLFKEILKIYYNKNILFNFKKNISIYNSKNSKSSILYNWSILLRNL